MAPCPMAMLSLNGLRIVDVNDAFTSATGWRREEVVGRLEAEIGMWGSGEWRDHLELEIRQTGHIRSADIQLRSKGGAVGDYLLSAETVDIHEQPCVLSVMLDITERKQTESELMAAVQSAMQDTSWLGQRIVEKLATITRARSSPAAQSDVSVLSNRAREVLSLLARGLSDDEVAERLGIARNTLRNHIAVIYSKLGVHKRSAAIIWARERGLGAPSKLRTRRMKSKKKTKA